MYWCKPQRALLLVVRLQRDSGKSAAPDCLPPVLLAVPVRLESSPANLRGVSKKLGVQAELSQLLRGERCWTSCANVHIG